MLYRELDPDIILLNSTGLKQTEIARIPGYNTIQRNLSGEAMDGTVIAVKQSIDFKELQTTSRMQAIEIKYRHISITIATAYLPPRHPLLPVGEIIKLANRTGPFILAGDFNARGDREENQQFNRIGTCINNLKQRNIIQTHIPDSPTFYGNFGTGTPDIVITNNKITHTINITTGPLTVSDHKPIIIIEWDRPITRIPCQPRPCYKQTNWEAIKDELSNVPLLNLQNKPVEDIDTATADWLQAIENKVREHTPLRTTTCHPHPKASQTANRLQVQLQQLTDRMRAFPAEYRQLRAEYVQLRQELFNELRRNVDQFYSEMFHDLTINGLDANFWRTIKNFRKPKTRMESIRDEAGNNIPPEQLLTQFRDHFQTQFSITEADEQQFDTAHEERIEHEWLEYQENDILPTHCDLTPNGEDPPTIITLAMTKELIKQLPKKAPGPSGINKNILQNCPDNILQNLAHIYSAALTTGHFPTPFKLAVLVPIPKPGKKVAIANHRPISLLEVPGKMLERIIANDLKHIVEGEEILQKCQYGFRPFLETDTTLALAYENIARYGRIRTLTIAMRDVQGAFDKVWTTGLKTKIHRLELPTRMKWILCDFITERRAKIRTHRQTGEIFNLTAGVPQGAILSPTLYNIYLSDLPSPQQYGVYHHTSKNSIYADDVTQIIESRPNLSAQTTAVRRHLEPVNDFEKRWKIKTNVAKFQLLPLGKKYPEKYLINAKDIKPAKKATLLGLKISRTNGLRDHVNYNVARASSALNDILKFKRLDQRTKLTLYKALVRPLLTYPAVILNSTKIKSHITDLQRVQSRALRKITNTKWDDFKTNQAIHEELNMEPINCHIHRLAYNTWERIQELRPNEYNSLLSRDIQFPHKLFSSSLEAANTIPIPKYI